MRVTNHKIILASNSPRRHELLLGSGLTFETRIIPGLDESYPENLQPELIAEFIAKKKAKEYLNSLENDEVLITADTIVLMNGTIYGKPTSSSHAISMLQELSGKTHTVITGVCLTSPHKQVSFSEQTEVTFEEMTDEEINYYVETYKPMDKAGAYGVQEWWGYIAVTKLEGSYFNVMGFPIHRIYKELRQFDN